MKITYLWLMPAVTLLMTACQKNLKDTEISPLSTKAIISASTAAPAWLISKMTYTNFNWGDTRESIFSYNSSNKPVREIRVTKTFNNQIIRDTMLYIYNSAQQLIRYNNPTTGASTLFKYDAQGRLSAIIPGELLGVKYSYINDTVVLADFGVRWIDMKPLVYAYAKVVYFIYDHNGNIRYHRGFFRMSLTDETSITDTTGMKPAVVAYGPYGNKPGVETAFNIPGPGKLGFITPAYESEEDYYPKFTTNIIFHSYAFNKYDYIYNAAGLPIEITTYSSADPVCRYKLEYIPAK
ncbi:MAG TPA: hypothetical protein VM802_27450 [Chitinophaga sp.]|uniref:hypothetical protein n=1 Tax=Chitinophaga sp. TaxID=1869181 RepID=UPI002CBFC2DF|nr:hypothetical protein [Chitinophaga sp.]HVI48635.1 hypothetical protein [Chitinophaga sp.]